MNTFEYILAGRLRLLMVMVADFQIFKCQLGFLNDFGLFYGRFCINDGHAVCFYCNVCFLEIGQFSLILKQFMTCEISVE